MTVLSVREGFGQFGNRLVLSAHLLAFCREHGFAFLNGPLGRYAHLLEAPTHRPTFSVPAFPVPVPRAAAERLHYRSESMLTRFSRWGRRADRLTGGRLILDVDLPPDRCLELSTPGLAEWFAGHSVVSLKGWFYRSFELVEKHAPFVRDALKLKAGLRDGARRTVDGLRDGRTTVVGVHCRGGDYREFRGGRYYYPPKLMSEKLRAIAEDLEGGARFLICSNDPIDPADFAGLDCRIAGRDGLPTGVGEDLAALSCCDLVVGPPSSFSLWAAFAGRTKLWHIESAEQRWSEEAAAPVEDLRWSLDTDRPFPHPQYAGLPPRTPSSAVPRPDPAACTVL